MNIRSTIRVGLALAALTGFGPASLVPAPSAQAAPAAKAPAKPRTAMGRTPTETVKNLIDAMQKKDKELIASAFNWQKFTDEMNKLLPGEKGLDAGTYKTLLVETLDVEKEISANLRVGPEVKKGANTATVEMRRVYPSGSGGTNQTRTINILSLAKEKDGWRIFRLDSAQPVTVPPPPVQQAPQGMVPAAGSERDGR